MIELKKHSENYYSIKDFDGDIRIENSKWDKLFSDLLNKNEIVYFFGFKLNFENSELKNTIDYVSEEILFNRDSHQKVLLKLKPSSLLFRGQLSNLWVMYEYPTLIFCNNINEKEFINYYDSKPSLEGLVTEFREVYALSKSFEEDVMWVRYSTGLLQPIWGSVSD